MHHADLLLVTVTKVESRAVLAAFQQATGREAQTLRLDDRIYFDLGQINGASVCLVQSEMGAAGLGAALQTVGKGIAALSPEAVIMVGIAFGMSPDWQAIGDILVSENLRPYELQRVGATQVIPRGDRPHASSTLLNLLKSADLRWEGPTVRFGVVLTGEKLVDNANFLEQLRSLEPEAIGGEMEGAGLYAACQDQHVDWILVKAICDWADGNKEADRAARQRTAASNAAQFVLHSLQFAPFHSRPVIDEPEPVAGVPSSLPPQPFFCGRDKELAIVAEAILPESRPSPSASAFTSSSIACPPAARPSSPADAAPTWTPASSASTASSGRTPWTS